MTVKELRAKLFEIENQDLEIIIEIEDSLTSFMMFSDKLKVVTEEKRVSLMGERIKNR